MLGWGGVGAEYPGSGMESSSNEKYDENLHLTPKTQKFDPPHTQFRTEIACGATNMHLKTVSAPTCMVLCWSALDTGVYRSM